nr:hypothetical protein [Streptomyces sp. SID13726]
MRQHRLTEGAEDEDFRRPQKLGRVGAWLCPDGSFERTLLVSHLAVCTTLMDDRVTDPAARAGDLAGLAGDWLAFDRVLTDPRAEPQFDGVAQRAVRDLWLRLREVATPGQIARLHQAFLVSFLGLTADAAHVAAGRPPTYEEYRFIRHATSTFSIFVVLLEVGNGFELPLPVAQDPDVAALTILAIQTFATAHEIVTCPRDVRLGDACNLAVILARENDTTVQEGMELAAAELRRLTERFLVLADRLRTRNLTAVQQYTAALKDMIAGVLGWLAETEKYAPSNPDPIIAPCVRPGGVPADVRSRGTPADTHHHPSQP